MCPYHCKNFFAYVKTGRVVSGHDAVFVIFDPGMVKIVKKPSEYACLYVGSYESGDSFGNPCRMDEVFETSKEQMLTVFLEFQKMLVRDYRAYEFQEFFRKTHFHVHFQFHVNSIPCNSSCVEYRGISARRRSLCSLPVGVSIPYSFERYRKRVWLQASSKVFLRCRRALYSVSCFRCCSY